jgi:hypothetical protein
MLTISTIPEALAELEKQTGRPWTDSELFDVVTKLGMELHAAAPITATVIVQEFVKGEGIKVKFEGMPIREGGLAVLYPSHVAQLWIGSETLTSSPYNRNILVEDGEHVLFSEPVRVTREQVRIRKETLHNILNVWRKAQTGRWIEDKSSPDGMRYQNGPDWMFPPEPVAPSAPATQQKESKRGITKQQIISAFEGLHFNTAAQWDNALADVPDWLEPGVIMKGKRGNNKQSTLWDPVQIAVALLGKNIPIKKLDSVFVRLGDWADEWRATSDYFR